MQGSLARPKHYVVCVVDCPNEQYVGSSWPSYARNSDQKEFKNLGTKKRNSAMLGNAELSAVCPQEIAKLQRNGDLAPTSKPYGNDPGR